jgi:hypothetical protein
MDIHAEVGEEGRLVGLLVGSLDPEVSGIDPLLLAIVRNEGRDTGPDRDNEKVRWRGRSPAAFP